MIASLVHGSWFMVHRKDNQSGFTLGEILVVIAVLATVGVILTQVFINTLRTSNKAQVITIIKQNGQNALEVLDKEIRNAHQVIGICDTDANITFDTIMIEDKEGGYKRYKFIMPTASNNGYITQEVITKTTLCPAPLISGYQILTDTNSQKGVSLAATSSFSQDSRAGFNDSITIDFTLRPAVGAPGFIREQVDPIQFKTTVQLR